MYFSVSNLHLFQVLENQNYLNQLWMLSLLVHLLLRTLTCASNRQKKFLQKIILRGTLFHLILQQLVVGLAIFYPLIDHWVQ